MNNNEVFSVVLAAVYVACRKGALNTSRKISAVIKVNWVLVKEILRGMSIYYDIEHPRRIKMNA